MADKVMTAPLGIIKVNGLAIGKVRNLRCTESIRLGSVVGIGTLLSSEAPVLGWSGSASCGSFLIDFSKPVFPGSELRKVQTPQEWEDTILLSNYGIQIDILRKVKDVMLPTGVIVPKLEVFASIKGAFMQRESFDISEGQISGRDTEFEYLTPILYSI